MKKLLVFLLAALCALLPAAGALAESTTVKTVVPSSHTITIDCGEGGSVAADGQTQTGVFTLDVERLGTLAVEITADEGWTLNQVTASPAAGVTISGNRIILADVYEDKTLTIRFSRMPEPTPTNTPVPTPTNTPEPTPTNTPVPTPTNTPVPTPTNTLEPEPTNTSTPTAKPTAAASPTPKATATAAASPTPTVTAKPAAVPVESLDNVLYDGYLGTGEGLGQLSIVFDEEYTPKDYELLPVVKGNELLICAKPDEAGQTVRRSLILSARQLQRLHEDCELGALLFRNGSMTVLADMAELYSGRMAKLMALGYEQGWENIPLDEIDWEALPEAELTAAQLSEARIEVCIIPELTEDEREGYSVQVFLRRDDALLEVTELVESLMVCLDTDELLTEENREQFTERYAVKLANGERELLLESVLRLLPDELSEEHPDESERFDVTILAGAPYPAVLYDASTQLRYYRLEKLTAAYAGSGLYLIDQR